MKYIQPTPMAAFYCAGSACSAPCKAPVDMTWTRTLGGLCETGLSPACPKAAELLLRKDKLTFRTERDDTPAAELSGLTPEQLDLMLDARATMDIILQNRGLPLRSRAVLALTYGDGFQPMITSAARYAYDEMDWGFTEQPVRQLSGVVAQAGKWEEKKSDLLVLLSHLEAICKKDSVLLMHLKRTAAMLEALDGEGYKTLRQQFDAEATHLDRIFENLMVCDVHRYFLAKAEDLTVLPGVQLLGVRFAALHTMALCIRQETGSVPEPILMALCRLLCRDLDETPANMGALFALFEAEPVFSIPRLQRMLWN